MAGKLPVSLDEITAGWMTGALQKSLPGVRVRTVTFEHVEQGTSTRAVVRIDYADRAGHRDAPDVVWLKGNFVPDRELMSGEVIYQDEVRFYRDLQSQLQINSPRCYFADFDGTGQGILLLEDLRLRGVRFGRGPEPFSRREAEQLVDIFAVLHARWWQSPALATEFAWANEPIPADSPYIQWVRQADEWNKRCQQVHAIGLPRRLLEHRVIEPALGRLQIIDRTEPQCVLHGDAHLGNMYIDANGAPGLLDWQCVRRGHWAHDVNYGLVSVLDIEDRRNWERDLLQRYLDTLQRQLDALGRDARAPTFDEAWLSYRQQNIYGLFFWITNTEEQQPRENNLALALRYAMATLDHETLQLLG
jgi:aminoglycoside phosphotransferase (APT) family kinase protein